MNVTNIARNLVRNPGKTCRRICRQIPHHTQAIYHTACKKYRVFQSRQIQLSAPSEVFSIQYPDREADLAQALELIRSFDRTIPVKTITDHFYQEPLVDKRVVIIGLGKGVRGNFQYILNELNASDDFDGFEIFVRTSPETDAVVQEYIRSNGWHRTKTVPKDGDYAKIMESAKYLITETFFSEAWVKKPGQVYINIWHGTPIKKLGQAKQFRNRHKDGNTQRNFIEADYLMYPNQHTKKCMLTSYGVENLMEGQILMNGYPRTGGLLQAAAENDMQLHRQLAPNNEHLYAYMPTFRDYYALEECVEQSRSLLDFLDGALTDDQLLYVNLHHKLNDGIDYSVYRHIRKFPAGVDSYRLLAHTDALISDYSSVFFDYLALRRQIILFADDWATYKKKRGVYMELKKLPFDIAVTKEGVLNAINQGKARREDGTYDGYYQKRYQKAFQKFCNYDSIDNAANLCRLISGKTEQLHLEEIPKNQKPQILIYSESFGPVPETEQLLQYSNTYDRSLADLYLSCDISKPGENRASAYPLLFQHPVIGTSSNPHPSAAGKVLFDLYQEEKISFDQAISLLRYDYSVMLIRLYGKAHFDKVLLYDIENPHKVIALAQMDTVKILFLPTHILEQLQNGDSFLLDAYRYAARFCSAVFVSSKDQIPSAQNLLSSSWHGPIQVLHTTEDFERLLSR